MISLADRIAQLKKQLDDIDKLRGTEKWSLGYQNAWCFLYKKYQALKAAQERIDKD